MDIYINLRKWITIKKLKKNRLVINYFNYNKQTNLLYDYEKDKFSKFTSEKEGSLLSIKGNELIICKDKIFPIGFENYFCLIIKRDSNYLLNFASSLIMNIKDPKVEPFINIRKSHTTTKNLFKIRINSVIKLGKLSFVIKQLVIKKNNNNQIQVNNNENKIKDDNLNEKNIVYDGVSPVSVDQSQINMTHRLQNSLLINTKSEIPIPYHHSK